MEKKIKFGVIGLGKIGSRHVQEILAHPQAELVDVWDIDTQKIPSEYHKYQNINDLVLNSNADVFHICTPNADHYPIAIEVIQAHKHVVIEKPITLESKHAIEIEWLAKKYQKHVFCVMQNRYSSVSQWLKEMITQNILGEIFAVNVHCAWNRDDRYYQKDSWHGLLNKDGGPLYTQFSHFVDLVFWLFGEIDILHQDFFNHNHKENTEFEDSGRFLFCSPLVKQGLFQYTTSVFERNFKSSIEIIGALGTVEVGGQYMNEVTYCHIKNYTMPKLNPVAAPNQYPGYQGSASNHHKVVENVIETLLGITTPSTPISEGISVVKIIENVYRKRNFDFF